MPATRNDVTHKPIMTTTSRRETWIAYTPMGKAIVIWADSEEEARQHAIDRGWQLTTLKLTDIISSTGDTS